MTSDQPIDSQRSFAQRLEIFSQHLTPDEGDLLRSMLSLASGDGIHEHSDRSIYDLALSVLRGIPSLRDPISRNPQPIPQPSWMLPSEPATDD